MTRHFTASCSVVSSTLHYKVAETRCGGQAEGSSVCLGLLKRNRGQPLQSSISRIYGDPHRFEGGHAEQRFDVVRAKDYSSGGDFTHEGDFGESEFIFFDCTVGQLVHRLTNGLDSRL